VAKVADSCHFMDFKVFIDGHLMTTCSQDLSVSPDGIISRTLWAPGQWGDAGYEGRQFFFSRNDSAVTAAEDGGLIEVQVFRAESRYLVAPSLRDFRLRRQYGIA